MYARYRAHFSNRFLYNLVNTFVLIKAQNGKVITEIGTRFWPIYFPFVTLNEAWNVFDWSITLTISEQWQNITYG